MKLPQSKRNELLRSFSHVKRLAHVSDSCAASRIYELLIQRYGRDIHAEPGRATDYNYININFSPESVRQALIGFQYEVPKEILMAMPRIERIRLFQGIGIHALEKGILRYSYVPGVDGRSVDSIVEDFVSLAHLPANYGIESAPPHEDIPFDCIRSLKRISDVPFEEYIETNQAPLYKGKDFARKRHSDHLAHIIADLRKDGYSVYHEVGIMARKGFITSVDAIALRHGEFLEIDAKLGTGLKDYFPRSEEVLRESASFFFYNFGFLPEMQIIKEYPKAPIKVSPPHMNREYAACFRLM